MTFYQILPMYSKSYWQVTCLQRYGDVPQKQSIRTFLKENLLPVQRQKMATIRWLFVLFGRYLRLAKLFEIL